ncbi:MAG: hypothetical protein M1823_005527 [Watsoniomyces obsoletus]|nr:MAG: hypothetical protein M1823_005527 [Watsoniomyces obsoletus]
MATPDKKEKETEQPIVKVTDHSSPNGSLSTSFSRLATTSTMNTPLRNNNAPSESSPSTSTSTSSTVDRAERKRAVLQKLRPPPLHHEWEFWHDRNASVPIEEKDPSDYSSNLVKLISINNVQIFWETFNNFPLGDLVLKDSVHLFKRTVKPVWEDPRNVNGGSWTFRVKKAQSAEWWKNIQLMAIGELLQDACEIGDDICGVSLSIRFGSDLISIWNRRGDQQKSIDAILEVVLRELPRDLLPKPATYYYKRHSEHQGFKEALDNVTTRDSTVPRDVSTRDPRADRESPTNDDILVTLRRDEPDGGRGESS